jgi:hypothetical protein
MTVGAERESDKMPSSSSGSSDQNFEGQRWSPALVEAGEGTVVTSCLAHASNWSLLFTKAAHAWKGNTRTDLGKRKEILEEFVGVDEETSREIVGNVEICVELTGVNEQASEELEVNLEISEGFEDVEEDTSEKFVGNVAIFEDLER